MPWCEECAKYYTPNSMNEDGSCPRCGDAIGAVDTEPVDEEKAPWHFKLMVVAVVAYLGWRVVEIFV
jgi:uncharacterized paraquat-inducible protein A